MMSTRIRNVAIVFSLAVLCAALIGCSSSNDGRVAELEEQLDMAETARMTAEQERDAVKTAQAAAEAARIAAEQAQAAAEAARMTAVQERDTAIAARMTAEQAQTAAEAAQTAAEQAQAAAEAAQTMAEQERGSARTAQTMAQVAQAAAEAARMAAEQARTTAETARMTAEQAVDDMRSAAVTNAIEKVTAFGGQPHRCANDTGCGSDSGVDYSSVSITHDIGYRQHGERLIHAVPWRGDDGQLEFGFRVIPENVETRELGYIFTFTDLWTTHRDDHFSGHTTSHSPIEDHGLGSQWQGFEGVKAYNGGGTLTVRFFTDLDDADDPLEPYTNWSSDTPEGEILLTDSRFPDLTGRDGTYLGIPEGGLKGTLDGVAGTFTCPEGYCSLTTSWAGPGLVPWEDSAPVLFTPDGAGQSRSIPASGPVSPSAEVPKLNYLSLGSWLYVPEIGADPDDYRFGIFAGGDDAFAGANLPDLAGTARYAGKATGMYAEKLDIDTFTADVNFMAEFGSASDFGSISGSVSNFELGSGKSSPLGELVLMDNGPDEPNIFPGWPGSDGSISGGFIGGGAHSNDGWQGGWDAKFYGNDATDPTTHPTSFAGAFAATDGDGHIAGSFGTYKQ